MAFFEGGLPYDQAMNMPLPELWKLEAKSQKIQKQRKKAAEKR